MCIWVGLGEKGCIDDGVSDVYTCNMLIMYILHTA